jgi:Tol biopolymer transport system component
MKNRNTNETEIRARQPQIMDRQAIKAAVACVGVAALLIGSAPDSPAQPVPARLASARSPSIAPPAGGNGDSIDPLLSPDGRFVVFSSTAGNLVPGDSRPFISDVFLRDRASNTTVLVSVNFSGTGGGNAHSMFGQGSTNGQYVVFQSDAGDLVPGDTNGVTDVFVRDVLAGITGMASVANDGSAGNAPSTEPVMTPDGRFVAFVSAATNLVFGDTNGIPDVFVRDLIAASTSLVSVGAAGYGSTSPMMATPAITPDGRYVAFFSTAAGMASGVTNAPTGEVYVRDLVSGQTTWASSNAQAMVQATFGSSTNYASYHPCLSDNGRFVTFLAGSTNASGPDLVLRADLVARTLAVINTNAPGANPDDDDPFGPEATSDGRFVAFVQAESGAGGSNSSVHVWDSQVGTDTAVSTNAAGGPPNTVSDVPVLSADGSFVVFLSNATNLTGNLVSNGFHLYRCNLQSGRLQLVDTDTNGVGSTDLSGAVPAISGDGRFVAFASPDGNLVAGDNNGALDAFLWDELGASMELISKPDPALGFSSASGISRLSQYALSADGQWITFDSFAPDLVTNDTNGNLDVFALNLTTGLVVLVSAGGDGNPALGGPSYGGGISADGRFVVFLSTATNLTANPPVNKFNIFRRDLQAGTTTLVSIGTNASAWANGDCSNAVISLGGRYVAFTSTAMNLAPGTAAGPNTFWRDITLGKTILLTNNSTNSFSPSLSADGRYIAYPGNLAGNAALKVRDTQTGADVFSSVAGVSPILSPDGSRLFYTFHGIVQVVNTTNGATVFSSSLLVPATSLTSGQWSTNGRFFVFAAVKKTSDTTNQIYLADLQNKTVTLVTTNDARTAAAKAPSDGPMISANGQFVVYRSFATDLVPGDFYPPPKLFLFDRLTGMNTLLMPSQTSAMPAPGLSQPILGAGGAVAAFVSTSSTLVLGDFNCVPDVFTVGVDSDGDGIPDAWMIQHFGHPTGEAGDLSRAGDDADQDGISNWQEYETGTDPNNPTSVFRIHVSAMDLLGGTTTLTFPVVPARSYSLQYKTNLNDAQWLNLAASISINGTLGTMSVPVDQPNRYYRVIGSE